MSSFKKLTLWQKYIISKELTGGRQLSISRIQQQIVKDPSYFAKRMRTSTKLKINRMIKPPEPLKYKINPYNEKDLYQPSLNFINKPPFFVHRTHTNMLPVYSEYKQKHQIKSTIIRNISGNVDDLAKEIQKITSNSHYEIKTGKIEVKGLHVEKIKHYLCRLGF